ncbi:hypothetical protein [Dactylosporangium sp. NPDC051541]|uniref:hypothetical protein n=1 Tax=Dactylosporangium sp. NPDC051541 TaxID=3363977 RepID=UPI0037BC91D6
MAAALLGAAVVLGAAVDLVSAAAGRPQPAVIRTDYTTPSCPSRSAARSPAPSHRALPPGRRSTWHCHRPKGHPMHPVRPDRPGPRTLAR